VIKKFRHKGLAELFEFGVTARIDKKMHARILARLDALDAAAVPEDMNVPGWNFHALTGFNPRRFTVHVNGPWCITFEFEAGDAYRLSLNSIIDTAMDRKGYAMSEYEAKRGDRCPTHPGAVIKGVLDDLKKPKTEVAEMLGISRQHLYDIMNEKQPITANVAVRIGKLFGNGPGLWLRMQAAYDTWHAERTIDLSKIPTLHVA
jgi:addiction module HigA family antidote